MPTADLVIRNANVHTVDHARPTAEAIAIRGDRILAVGSDERIANFIAPTTRTIDAAGRRVVPGFHDAHAHVVWGGQYLLQIDLRPAQTPEQMAEILRDYLADYADGEWIVGGCWDHESWPADQRRYPTRKLIDPVTPENPALLRRLDGHIAVANTLALQAAGINAETPDPEGGTIGRDEHGRPNGVLIDTAIALVGRIIPQPTLDDLLAGGRAAMAHAASLGVTSIRSMSDRQEFIVLQELLRRGELTCRCGLHIRDEGTTEHLAGLGLRRNFGNDMLRIDGVKLFADGSFGAGSALLFEPYDDNPATAGLAIHSQAELTRRIVATDAAGVQVAVHAIGDKAVHWCLNGFQAARDANGSREMRHAIEHAQMIIPEDLPRFAELGVVASIQPSHCIDDMRFMPARIGKRTARCHPVKSLFDHGASVCFGSDWYVETLNPMQSFYAAVTREFPDGGPEGGWHGEEKIDRATALAAATLGGAFAEFQEDHKGSITPGKLADVVILDRDILTCPPREILSARPTHTILGGRVIYEADATSTLR